MADNEPKKYSKEQMFQRFVLCKGEAALQAMDKATVLQLGVGAVGGFATEVMARSGLGKIILIDFDTVDVSNINRQIVATSLTVGEPKVEIMERRLKEINPYIEVVLVKQKVGGAEVKQMIEQHKPTLVCDCIDLFIQKCEIIRLCLDMGIPIVSSMGAARKNNPKFIQLSRLEDINTCPLAKRVKKTLGLDGSQKFPTACCVLSKEKAMPHPLDEEGKKMCLPSFSVITTMFGVWVANAAISWIIEGKFPTE